MYVEEPCAIFWTSHAITYVSKRNGSKSINARTQVYLTKQVSFVSSYHIDKDLRKLKMDFTSRWSLKPFNFTFLLLWLSHFQAAQSFTNFIFGDSLVDVGNNNYIFTLSKADSSPYGIDFGPSNGQPTGRFTNGRTISDIVGMYVYFRGYTYVERRSFFSVVYVIWPLFRIGFFFLQ